MSKTKVETLPRKNHPPRSKMFNPHINPHKDSYMILISSVSEKDWFSSLSQWSDSYRFNLKQQCIARVLPESHALYPLLNKMLHTPFRHSTSHPFAGWLAGCRTESPVLTANLAPFETHNNPRRGNEEVITAPKLQRPTGRRRSKLSFFV